MSGHERKRAKSTKNVPSILLGKADNETLFGLLGRGCKTLGTGVVQLFLADNNRWSKACCGVACFEKDNPKRSYFIRIYSIVTCTQLWEQELYNHFRYKTPCLFFHTFEADDGQVGLNFASEDEAFKFKESLEQKLVERHIRVMERKRIRRNPSQDGGQEQEQPRTPDVESTIQTSPTITPNIDSNKLSTKSKDKKKKDKKKKGLSKADISGPQAGSFQHIAKVGWDSENGLMMSNLDPSMKELLTSFGMDENDHKNVDAETVEFIYDFVDTYGGVDAIKSELSSRPPSVISTVLAPRSSSAGRNKPSIMASKKKKALPSLPEESTKKKLPPKPKMKQPPPAVPKKSPASPPAAPPPGNVPAPPPPPPTGWTAPIASSPSTKRPPPPPRQRSTDVAPPAVSGDATSNLLSAIRSGTTLKRVEKSEDNSGAPVIADNPGGIMGLLAKALDTRSAQIHGSDSETSDDEDSDWD